jgi:glycosyltransferase involved in cell wall biosynthesis
LILTSSFPSSPDDETCGYIRDFASSMSASFDVEVLAPPDRRAVNWSSDVFKLTRSASLLPIGLDSLQASSDLNELASGSLTSKLCLLPSLFWFFSHAFARSLRADVICSHWLLPSGLAGAIASRILRKPHIVIEHSGALHFLARSRTGRSIAKFIISGSSRVVVVSPDLKQKLLKMCPDAGDRIEVVPMGIMSGGALAIGQRHFNEEASIPCTGVAPWAPLLHDSAIHVGRGAHGGAPVQVELADPQTVLFVGRLVEIKGVDLLLTAMKGMADLQLTVAGDGEKRRELEARARSLSVAATFVGRVGALQREELFAACDVVVIPSRVLAGGRTEGTPVVCLEAMLAGRVVVASRTGGLKEIIVDGQNGLLFEPCDHRMLREKLTLALGDEHLRERISANARRTAQAYDWSQIGERFSKIIESALQENGQPRNSRIQAGDFCG